MCGFSLGEYIRNRRLSLAGAELATGKTKVIDVALKYGYESPDSFAKAFYKFHGILPSQAQTNGNLLKSYSRLALKFSLEGGKVMNYRIEKKPQIKLLGLFPKERMRFLRQKNSIGLLMNILVCVNR